MICQLWQRRDISTITKACQLLPLARSEQLNTEGCPDRELQFYRSHAQTAIVEDQKKISGKQISVRLA
jgi:hypothetical protein